MILTYGRPGPAILVLAIMKKRYDAFFNVSEDIDSGKIET